MKHAVEREKGVISVPEGGILAKLFVPDLLFHRCRDLSAPQRPVREGGGGQGSVTLGILVTAHCRADGMGAEEVNGARERGRENGRRTKGEFGI